MAIAFDAQAPGPGSTSPTTWTHTCTGSNLILILGIWANAGDVVTGVTYNSVNMTQVSKRTDVRAGASRTLYLYYLLNPSTGANTVSITSSSGLVGGQSASYTGAKQSGQPDSSSAGATSAGATSITDSTTTVADNSWAIMFARNFTNSCANGTNWTLRGSAASVNIGDKNAAVSPAGSISMTANDSLAQSVEWQALSLSFSPAAATAASKRLAMLLGIGQ